jgi:SAM-dependent methyltransferase
MRPGFVRASDGCGDGDFMIDQSLANMWTSVMAPDTGDVRTELVQEAAEYLSIPIDEAWRRLRGACDRFRDEWLRTVPDPKDPEQLIDFYNRSDTELFELIEWHASDPIHYRTLIIRDFALRHPGRTCLDYGSGIGSDALVFAQAGFDVTLADVSDLLLGFAAFRCRKRGARVQTIDLKKQSLPEASFDVVVCLDVLEHILEPLQVVGNIRRGMRDGGLLMMHAPFGDDPERPMHVVHQDVVTPRMRSLGFRPIDVEFPFGVRASQLYRKEKMTAFDRLGYYIYDGYLNNSAGACIAACYRRLARFRRAWSLEPGA